MQMIQNIREPIAVGLRP